MAETKTRPTPVRVEDFIDGVEEPRRREDARALAALMAEVSGHPATMWGPSIIGFGRYHYRYASGHQGDAALAAFSPRKANLVLYLNGDEPARSDLLSRLGKHKTGKGCIYVNRLSDLDPEVLRAMVRLSIETMQARYPA